MPAVSLLDARARALASAKAFGSSTDWAKSLPDSSIDAQASSHLAAAATAPSTLIERCNPFDVMGQLTDVSSLLELVSRLRTEALTLEGMLILEVLADDRLSRSYTDRQTLAEEANRADSKQAGNPAPDPGPVTRTFGLEKEALEQRYAFRREPGHPWNLLERIKHLRSRYCADLSRLLAKASAAQYVLQGSFGIKKPGPLRVTYGPDENPIPVIEDWLRDLSIQMEDRSASERVLTVYRYAINSRWASNPGNLANDLRKPGRANFEVAMSPDVFAIGAGETGRVLAVGFALVFGYEAPYDDKDETARVKRASDFSAFYAELRAMERRVSYGGQVHFPATEYISADGQKFNFPGAIETFAGIGAWGAPSGPLREHVVMQSSRRIANRPIDGSKVRIEIDADTFNAGRKTDRDGLPFGDAFEETKLVDVVLAFRIAVSK